MIRVELVITRRARIDIDEIFVWYEEQQPGLGERFIQLFEETLVRINRNPYHASNIEKEARSASLKKFPYEVIYYIDEDRMQVRIIAVIHQYRSAKFFRKRLRE